MRRYVNVLKNEELLLELSDIDNSSLLTLYTKDTDSIFIGESIDVEG